MVKSVISCSGLYNCVEFSVGDMVRDEEGSVFLVTDENTVVVLHCKELIVGTTYSTDESGLHLAPKGLSVTLTQE